MASGSGVAKATAPHERRPDSNPNGKRGGCHGRHLSKPVFGHHEPIDALVSRTGTGLFHFPIVKVSGQHAVVAIHVSGVVGQPWLHGPWAIAS